MSSNMEVTKATMIKLWAAFMDAEPCPILVETKCPLSFQKVQQQSPEQELTDFVEALIDGEINVMDVENVKEE